MFRLPLIAANFKHMPGFRRTRCHGKSCRESRTTRHEHGNLNMGVIPLGSRRRPWGKAVDSSAESRQVMHLREWSHSNLEYAWKLVNSGLEGALSGEEEFLQGSPLAPFLSDCAHKALLPAAVGACVAVLGSCLENGHQTATRTLGFGLLGSVLGFAAGMAWCNRRLAACVASGALKRVDILRDKHWLEKNPIDYA
jgi:hypothetical protein